MSGTTRGWRSVAAGSLARTGRLVLICACCRFGLAIVFLAAGTSKVVHLASFADFLVLHSGLPVDLARLVGLFLPWLELTLAACLLFGRATREAATILAVLLAAFLGYTLIHVHENDCGCFFFAGQPQPSRSVLQGLGAILRDLLLLAACLLVAWKSPAVTDLTGSARQPATPAPPSPPAASPGADFHPGSSEYPPAGSRDRGVLA